MIDVMIDLETLGTADDAMVIQIGAKAFRLGASANTPVVGNLMPDDPRLAFNHMLSFSDNKKLNIETDTLKFWLKDSANVATFQSILARSSNENQDVVNDLWRICDTEYNLWHGFNVWLGQLNQVEPIRVWGNGISFDIVKVSHNFKKFDLPVPYKFWNERDVRTITQLASDKLGITPQAFQRSVPNVHHHDALADVNWQIDYVQKAYSIVV